MADDGAACLFWLMIDKLVDKLFDKITSFWLYVLYTNGSLLFGRVVLVTC